jgi:glycosyltransferase involved in cell wall biosynthesis
LVPVLLGLYLGCIGIQLVYLIFIFSKIGRHQRNIDAATQLTEPKTDFSVGVSVVVCAWNELENLRELLPLLLRQDHPDFEVIVVDDRSDDECYDYLLYEALKHDKLRLVRINEMPQHITPKKYALTLGIKAARNELILLTDADCRPVSDQWIREMQSSMKDEKEIVLGFSPYEVKSGLLNFFIRYETFYTAVQYLSFALAGYPYMGVGRNLMYKKSLFFRNNGFHSHQSVVGGDDDLFIKEVANRKNVNVCLQPNAFMVSLPKTTFREWFHQKKRHLSVGKHYKFRDKFLLGLLTFSQVGFWVSLVPLLIWGGPQYVPVVAGFFLLRMLALTIVLDRIHKRLDATFEWYCIPLFDFLYIFYYLFTGITALFTKKIQWN